MSTEQRAEYWKAEHLAGNRVIDEQAERIRVLERLVIDAAYTLEKARIWNGMDWTYNPLHPVHYVQMRKRLRDECDNIDAIRAESECNTPQPEPPAAGPGL